MRVLLPVGRSPLLTYLFYLHPLSILAQEDTYLPWFYSRFIQLLRYPGECLKMLVEAGSTSPQVGHAYALNCPLLDVQSLELEAAAALSADWAAGCAALLGKGYYVQTDVDYYHLTHRPECGQEHFLHELLLVGVDGEQLLALTNGRRGEPVQVEVSGAALRRATAELASVRSTRAAASGQSPWLTDVSGWGRPRVVLYRYHPERGCAFDPVSVLEQVSDYVDAANSSWRCRLSGMSRSGGLWGIAVYGWLHHLVELLHSGHAEWDPLTWRALREHKAGMVQRLAYMAQHGVPAAASLVDEYRPVAAWARTLQVLLLRWSAASAAPPVQRQAHDLLLEMAATEGRVLRRLL